METLPCRPSSEMKQEYCTYNISMTPILNKRVNQEMIRATSCCSVHAIDCLCCHNKQEISFQYKKRFSLLGKRFHRESSLNISIYQSKRGEQYFIQKSEGNLKAGINKIYTHDILPKYKPN